MSYDDVFRRLTEFVESWQQRPPQLGVALAEVTQISEQGYVLSFLSGNHDAPSVPARVASFAAGRERGAHFMPEVGDEVVVAFELGDINRPVIIGALWSDVDPPPQGVDSSASNNVRTITSRQGHRVLFDDTPGAGKIVIATQGGLEISIEDGPSPKIKINTTGAIATSRLVLDGVAWNHQHATGTGPSGPPLSIVPVL